MIAKSCGPRNLAPPRLPAAQSRLSNLSAAC
jgi:hypothetical protein